MSLSNGNNKGFLAFYQRNLFVFILIALVAGIGVGYVLPHRATWFTWMGDLFIRGLKMVIVPLILSSIISGVSNLGQNNSLGRLTLKTLGYYVTTSLLAILTGLLLVNLIEPGVGAPLPDSTENLPELSAEGASLKDTLLRMIPTNVFAAFSQGQMLSTIFFAVLFGVFITKVKEARYRDLLSDFFNATFEVMMGITMFVILFTPLGVFGLVVDVVAEQAGDKAKLALMAASLGKYMLTVIAGLGIHAFVTLPLLMLLLAGINPIHHFRAMLTPLITAFSTSSSGATLPLTMEALEHKAGISNRITSFTIPLGATINMDGTALYECVAAMFIAQAYNIHLDFGQQLIVVITALLASIGAAGIPMAGLVMISVILSAVGLPLEGVGMILAVDRILDMMRTAVNVWSDSCGAAIIARSEGETTHTVA
ncbi:dicarboxylate/amino acid:cation symporter [Thermonema rossianum]|uniref:dicarboxylate/amino acid:cation symporter n=1 Tax=Thermonema rossianum TaxID=55505 RepID=UPI0006908DFA|nr:dicarboxylate/amino acid:cation symporter [Thermonema rossianum]